MDNNFEGYTRHPSIDHKTNSRSLWDKIWRDVHGSVVIAQRPNIWLIIWLILEVVSLFVSSQHVALVTWWLATAALSIWALLEIFRGVNYFRRILGLCVAILTIMTVFGLGL
jgi:hypothetical protein